MEKNDFHRKISGILKKVVRQLGQKYNDYKIEVDDIRKNTYFTIKTKKSMLKVLIFQSGDIVYRMWDSIGITSKDYLYYYNYNECDDHDRVIKKTEKDFKIFLTMYFENPHIHDLTDLEITFENDNKNAFNEYKQIIQVN